MGLIDEKNQRSKISCYCPFTVSKENKDLNNIKRGSEKLCLKVLSS
jgi:hypothetical protein